MRYRNRIIAGVILLAVIFAALYFIPLRRNVDKSMPCVAWNVENPTVGDAEGIAIKGKYYDYLLRDDDYFVGKVIISDLNSEAEVSDLKLLFNDVKIIGGKQCLLHYFSSKYQKIYYVGSLFMDDLFDKVCIFVDNEKFYQFDGKYISAPAATIEEAVAIAESMNLT